MQGAATVEVTVVAVRPVGRGRLLALATVELMLDGVGFVIHGIQVLQLFHPVSRAPATGIELPRYRSFDGSWRLALELPDELHEPIAPAVLKRCCENRNHQTSVRRGEGEENRTGTAC